jgi:hypothetical protein
MTHTEFRRLSSMEGWWEQTFSLAGSKHVEGNATDTYETMLTTVFLSFHFALKDSFCHWGALNKLNRNCIHNVKKMSMYVAAITRAYVLC